MIEIYIYLWTTEAAITFFVQREMEVNSLQRKKHESSMY